MPVQIERGFSSVKKKVEKASRYLCSCTNCDSYYQAEGDTEECRQDSYVLSFDITITENNGVCTRWKPLKNKKRSDSLECKEEVPKARKLSSSKARR